MSELVSRLKRPFATVAIGLFTLAASGCTSANKSISPEARPSSTAATATNPKLQLLAASILAGYSKAPAEDRRTSKPPKTFSYTLAGRDGSKVTLAVQDPAAAQAPNSVASEWIHFSQSTPGQKPVAGDFYPLGNGKFTASCDSSTEQDAASVDAIGGWTVSGKGDTSPDVSQKIADEILDETASAVNQIDLTGEPLTRTSVSNFCSLDAISAAAGFSQAASR